MKKFTLGVFFDADITSGGNFQESLNNILLCKNLISEDMDVKIITNLPENVNFLKKFKIDSHLYSPTFLEKLWLNLRTSSNLSIYRLFRLFKKKNSFEAFLENLKIDLIYFCTQSLFASHIETINYIFTVFDLAHRDYPEFPEVRNFRIFEQREEAFQKNIKRAVAVLVESNMGRDNLTTKYSISHNRVYVFPLSTGTTYSTEQNQFYNPDKKVIEIKKKYNLKNDYIFYPAQFWSHKNHIYILKALQILEEEDNIVLSAIFSGSDKGNLPYIKKMTKNMNLENRVFFPGFVNNEELHYLYSQSIALIMPTYFGPTNIPPLEAFKYNIPVLYSDLPGLREQVGSAALLLDLEDPRSLVLNIKKLLSSNDLKNHLITQGQLNLKKITSQNEKLKILKKIIDKFKVIRDCWE
tara:strand:- start:11880 stop:13109 length:1230 start_codon:yes stop_codon:yes gene_type:complete